MQDTGYSMRDLLRIFSGRVSGWMEILAGMALIGIMLLIGADIVGRAFGWPVPGTYELVSMAGGLIIGLALPATSRAKGHVSTDILLARLRERPKLLFISVAKIIGIVVFLLAGYGMIMMGVRLRASGEVTAVLALPFYYVAFAIAAAFLVQPLILFCDIFNRAPESENSESRYE